MAELYRLPHQFSPLMPGERASAALREKAAALLRALLQAGRQPLPRELGRLLRAMNSYYTNKIEGHHTRPIEIEQALRKEFSGDASLARRQRLAVAHMQAEDALEQAFPNEAASGSLWSTDSLRLIHQTLFALLPDADQVTEEGERFMPGELRPRDVSVGRHDAPAHDSVPAFLAEWERQYASARSGEETLIAIAAAHQRLGWVHPFVDGNGRVMRLHTHLALHSLGYTQGVWSPLRGFARNHQRYYELLANADMHRKGDLDGRGNLSESALVAWIDFVLDVCIDQVQFMGEMLQTGTMRDRIAACLHVEAMRQPDIKLDALVPLHYLFLNDEEMDRGLFKSMMGHLSDRTAQKVVSALLDRQLLVSDSPKGKVRFGMPQHALRFYFPALWPEAEASA